MVPHESFIPYNSDPWKSVYQGYGVSSVGTIQNTRWDYVIFETTNTVTKSLSPKWKVEFIPNEQNMYSVHFI